MSEGDFSAYIAARFDHTLPGEMVLGVGRAARFDHTLPGEMVLGDGSASGPADVFVNHPLRSGQLYRVFVTAYTSPSVSTCDDFTTVSPQKNYSRRDYLFIYLFSVAFSAYVLHCLLPSVHVTLLVWHQEEHPACKI